MGASRGRRTDRADAAVRGRIARAEQARRPRRRNRTIGTLVGGSAALALAAAAFFVLLPHPSTEDADGDPSAIVGLRTWTDLPRDHVTTDVDYAALFDMSPPAGGPHDPVWLDCGRYDEPQRDENAVHSLEHGAVWVTYDPTLVTDAQVDALTASLPSTYVVVSPYPGLGCAVAASAWGAQVRLDSPTDPRLGAFVSAYWRSPSAPEPTAPCTGGVVGDGLVVS